MKRAALFLLIGCLLSVVFIGCDLKETLLYSNPHWWIEKGIKYYDDGDMKSAEDAFEHAVSLDPENAEGYRRLGVVNRERGNYNEARLTCTGRYGSIRTMQ